jgi:hypothetical protein
MSRDEHEYVVAQKITDAVNVMGLDKAKLAMWLSQHHRTLQQTLFGIFLQLAVNMALAYKDRQYDLRNEASCEIACQIYEEILEGSDWIWKDKVSLPYV